MAAHRWVRRQLHYCKHFLLSSFSGSGEKLHQLELIRSRDHRVIHFNIREQNIQNGFRKGEHLRHSGTLIFCGTHIHEHLLEGHE